MVGTTKTEKMEGLVVAPVLRMVEEREVPRPLGKVIRAAMSPRVLPAAVVVLVVRVETTPAQIWVPMVPMVV